MLFSSSPFLKVFLWTLGIGFFVFAAVNKICPDIEKLNNTLQTTLHPPAEYAVDNACNKICSRKF